MKLFIGPAGSALAVKGQGAEASFEYLHGLGLNAQELEFVQQVYLSAEKAPGVGEASRKWGIRLSIHAPYYINLCTDDVLKLAASKKRIADSLDRAERLGAQGPVVVHAGFYQKKTPKQCFEDVVNASLELSSKYPHAVLGYETTGKHTAFGNLQELLDVCAAAGKSNVVPVVDFAHLYARQMGNLDFGGVLDALLEHGHRSIHCHYSGINYGKAGEKNHLPLSSNQPDYSALATALKERENKFELVSLVCESPLLEQDALALKTVFETCGLKL